LDHVVAEALRSNEQNVGLHLTGRRSAAQILTQAQSWPG
jgi:hypothetical protein